MARTGFKAAIAVLAMVMFAGCASAQRKGTVLVVAGDDLSDRGNVFAVTQNEIPPPDYYYQGSFTNAPGAWDRQIDTPNTTYAVRALAYGGATACTYPDMAGAANFSILDLQQQIADFQNKVEDADYLNTLVANDGVGTNRTLVAVIWAGHNDVAMVGSLPSDQQDGLAGNIVDCIANATRALLDTPQLNISTIVIGNLAPVDQAPAVTGSDSADQVASLVTDVNSGISELVNKLQGEAPETTRVLLWDVNNALTAAATGSDLSTEPCLDVPADYNVLAGDVPNGNCSDANSRIWYDNIHPTAAVHELVMNSFEELLNNDSNNSTGDSGNSTAGGTARKMRLF